jgi:GNAT superfamily N-acetyltransferase
MSTITLRTAQPEDSAVLLRVYTSTRADEMALTDWTAEQKAAFCKMQFDAQTEHYRVHYPNAVYFIIQKNETPIGRLILEHSEDQLLIMDISILPEFRNTGIGTGIIRNLQAEAAKSSLPLVLRVEFFNPVIRLYARLGFVETRKVNDVYHEMIWKPAAVPA